MFSITLRLYITMEILYFINKRWIKHIIEGNGKRIPSTNTHLSIHLCMSVSESCFKSKLGTPIKL